jgi:hypothetical protein
VAIATQHHRAKTAIIVGPIGIQTAANSSNFRSTFPEASAGLFHEECETINLLLLSTASYPECKLNYIPDAALLLSLLLDANANVPTPTYVLACSATIFFCRAGFRFTRLMHIQGFNLTLSEPCTQQQTHAVALGCTFCSLLSFRMLGGLRPP